MTSSFRSMIPYKELREINAKLWILIWVNVAVIT